MTAPHWRNEPYRRRSIEPGRPQRIRALFDVMAPHDDDLDRSESGQRLCSGPRERSANVGPRFPGCDGEVVDEPARPAGREHRRRGYQGSEPEPDEFDRVAGDEGHNRADPRTVRQPHPAQPSRPRRALPTTRRSPKRASRPNPRTAPNLHIEEVTAQHAAARRRASAVHPQARQHRRCDPTVTLERATDIREPE